MKYTKSITLIVYVVYNMGEKGYIVIYFNGKVYTLKIIFVL